MKVPSGIRILAATCGVFFPAAGFSGASEGALLRFVNGDQLHGSFVGWEGGKVKWRRQDVAEAVPFRTGELRQIVFHGGKPAKMLPELAYVKMADGDDIPGRVVEMDGDALVMRGAFPGELRLPRDRVAMLAPAPFGGRLRYHGPFQESEWSLETAEGTVKPSEMPKVWEFSGSAWYGKSGGKHVALARKEALPERSSVRFDLAWRGRLSLAVGLFADFSQAGAAEVKAGSTASMDPNVFAGMFGNSHVLHLFPNYYVLYRCTVDEKGQTKAERIVSMSQAILRMDSQKASVELRTNRESGSIALHVNGEFITEWSKLGGGAKAAVPAENGAPEEAAEVKTGISTGLGTGLGFAGIGDGLMVRVSDVIISEWNGMPDPARSMELGGQDVLLLTNGTDRLAGDAENITGGTLAFSGRHGKFRIPLEEVAELRFATDKRGKPAEPSAESVTLRFQPFGSISGALVSADEKTITLRHPAAGVVDVPLPYVAAIEFDHGARISDEWNENF